MEGRGLIAVFGFNPQAQPLVVKVALSPVSEENAIANMDAEVPGFDFDAVHAAATALWTKEFQRIDITASPDMEKNLVHGGVPCDAVAKPEYGCRRQLSRS